DVSHLGEVSPAELALHADAEVRLTRDIHLRIDGIDRPEHALGSGATGEWIRQVPVFDRDRWHERRQVHLREYDVALRLVVKDADASADHGFLVERIGSAEPRHDELVRVVQTARRPGRYQSGRNRID